MQSLYCLPLTRLIPAVKNHRVFLSVDSNHGCKLPVTSTIITLHLLWSFSICVSLWPGRPPCCNMRRTWMAWVCSVVLLFACSHWRWSVVSLSCLLVGGDFELDWCWIIMLNWIGNVDLLMVQYYAYDALMKYRTFGSRQKFHECKRIHHHTTELFRIFPSIILIDPSRNLEILGLSWLKID